MKLILLSLILLTMHSLSFSQKISDSTRRMAAKGDVLVQKNTIYDKAEAGKPSASAGQHTKPKSHLVVVKKKHKRHIKKRKVSLMK